MIVRLPNVDMDTIPEIWRRTPLPHAEGKEVCVYRGFARDVQKRRGAVVPPGEIGGQLSRRVDAAQDAVYNQYGRDPDPATAGVVKITIPPEVWDQLVDTNSLSERSYIGFSRRLKSTEIRVNSSHAALLINSLPHEVVAPDPAYDFRRR